MLLNLKIRRTWIPDILGNDKLPSDEKIIVEYDKPNAVDRGNWQRRIASTKSDGTRQAYVDTNTRAILSESNVSIQSLRIKTGEKIVDGKPVDIIEDINTGAKLADAHSDFCWLLATQLATKIMEVEISEELLKNSDADSGPAS
jgi:hypothetical protein